MTERTLRTEEDIRSITKIAGDMIWIKNLQSEGDHDYVDALFDHNENYSLTTISTAVHVVRDTHGEYRPELLTADLLNTVEMITEGLYGAIVDRSCGKWSPDEFRPLAKHFTSHPEEWGLALQIIRLRGITNYGTLMGLLPQFKDSASAPALLNGTL
jgi:hypothetical protein